MNTRRLQYGISIAAIVVAFIHVICPNIKIDVITIVLLFIALIPWLSPLFKSLEFPGGWKIEFQEVKQKVDTMMAKQIEPVFRMKGFSVNDEGTRLVIKALGNPNYTWRYLGGLKDETKLPVERILKAIKWLLDNKLVTEVSGKDGPLWGLSVEGRNLLSSILREETTEKET